MDQQSNTSIESRVKKPRVRRYSKEKEAVTTERDSLEVHVDICQMRYQQLDDRIGRVETRMDKIEAEIKQLKDSTQENFDDIKSMISAKMSQSHQALITASGTVIVALIGFLGYLLTHLPK